MVEDGVARDVEVVGGGAVPGEGDEPGGSDDGLKVGGGGGDGVKDR